MGIKEKVKKLPGSPGVYLMKDNHGAVLYVGKAVNLKKRVASYFRHNASHAQRIASMVSQVEDIDCMPTNTEAEALIYENSLIKQFSPKYNVALKDGKSYPLLKLTASEKFPRLLITREKKDDDADYFGPYSNAKLLRSAVTIMKRIFQLRTCAKMPKSVCLNYHIKQCLGPCEGKIDEKRYKDIITELKMFLRGRKKELLDLLSEKMVSASKREDYEEALRLRDRIEALGSIRSDKVIYGPMSELSELKEMLGLKSDIDLIEAFDISNIMGEEAVGSMISFHKGKPNKSGYRKFRIRSVEGIDDYSMMREVVRRRYQMALKEGSAMPDLILIDGGKGHLSVTLEELKKLGLSGIPAIGIAKEFEHIYLKDRKDPVVLPEGSKALHLLERIRDEAHRFAITYHKKLMSKRVGLSELNGIPGVGPKRRKALMLKFGSVEGIKSATLEELIKLDGMDARSAKNIIEHFKGQKL
jgi:excinuclease ABC subunit C